MTDSQPKQYMMSVFCDLSNACDVIDHTILLAKLEYHGFRGIVKKWLADYLSNRTQFVEFESYKSNTRNIECGVPQGSILAPLLYLIYVNDIPRAANADILSFADDTSLLLSNPDIEQLYITGADPGFFPRGGPVGHRHIATETPQAFQGKIRRGVWGASPKKILNMKCSRSDSEQTWGTLKIFSRAIF